MDRLPRLPPQGDDRVPDEFIRLFLQHSLPSGAGAPAIEVEIVNDPIGARHLTVRIGVSVLPLLMLLVARALGFDVQVLLRMAMQLVR
jgi:hypothetical protein